MGSENGSLPANGVWKWIAALLVTVIIAGTPAIVASFKAPSKDEVEVIRERQVQVLIRLSAIDEQLRVNEALLNELQDELREHENAR